MLYLFFFSHWPWFVWFWRFIWFFLFFEIHNKSKSSLFKNNKNTTDSFKLSYKSNVFLPIDKLKMINTLYVFIMNKLICFLFYWNSRTKIINTYKLKIMLKINPYLNFAGNCEEAMTFYKKNAIGVEFRTGNYAFWWCLWLWSISWKWTKFSMHSAITIGNDILMASDVPSFAPIKFNAGKQCFAFIKSW